MIEEGFLSLSRFPYNQSIDWLDSDDGYLYKRENNHPFSSSKVASFFSYLLKIISRRFWLLASTCFLAGTVIIFLFFFALIFIYKITGFSLCSYLLYSQYQALSD